MTSRGECDVTPNDCDYLAVWRVARDGTVVAHRSQPLDVSTLLVFSVSLVRLAVREIDK